MKKFYIVDIEGCALPIELSDTFKYYQLATQGSHAQRSMVVVHTELSAENLYLWVQEHCREVDPDVVSVLPVDVLDVQLGVGQDSLQDWAKARLWDEQNGDAQKDVIVLHGSDYVTGKEPAEDDIVRLHGKKYIKTPELSADNYCKGCAFEHCDQLCKLAPACENKIYKEV